MYNICRNIINGLWICLISVFFTSCDDIVEDDLAGKRVTIISPSDSLHTAVSTVQFNWEAVEEASGYRIQIARPNFDEIEWLMYDSLSTLNSLVLSLAPGNYQWRIRPENSSSFGDYTSRTLSIDSTLNLSNQQIILQAPLNNFITNSTEVLFSWFQLYNATQYSFLLKYDDWNGAMVLPEVLTTDNGVTITDLPEGTFAWGVRGESDLSITQYAQHSFTTDFTSPLAPTLVAPANNATSASPVLLDWTRPIDSGTALHDSVFIYSDANLSNIAWAGSTVADSVSRSLTTGTYYWLVKCLDAAGNVGAASTTRSFYIP